MQFGSAISATTDEMVTSSGDLELLSSTRISSRKAGVRIKAGEALEISPNPNHIKQ
jgi:hypothetical protein